MKNVMQQRIIMRTKNSDEKCNVAKNNDENVM